jgi:TonB family protein
MVYSNAPIPFSRGTSKPRVFLHNIVPDNIEPFLEESQKTLVLDALRHQISGGANIEDVLESAASAAQELTSASGAAVAMGVGETVLCVGRSGETAPPLGAQVSVNSGISGECIRSAKYVICDDTQLDKRVDAEVCLSLGLRSLAAVPLRAPGDTIGLLEVFSNYQANFSPEHVETLRSIGDFVELAYSRISTKAVAAELSVAEEAAAQASIREIEESCSEPRAIAWLRDSHLFTGEKKYPFWAIPIVLIVVLLSFRAYVSWHAPAQVAVAAPAAASQEITISTEVATKPNPARETNRRKAAKAEKADVPPVVETSEAPEVAVRKSAKPDSTEDADNAPELPVLASNSEVIRDLVAREATMPKAAMMVSRGVVRGVITHKVPPMYPADALADGVAGAVVLKATINEKGSVAEVSPVSGPRVLARAAAEAVRKWQYQPSLLNGTPVQVETEITVNFKKPSN